MADWIDACATYDIEEEVIRFDRDSRTFIIVRDHEDNYYCTDGMCTCLTGWWSKPPSNAIAVGNWLTPVPPHRSPHAR